MRIRITDSFQTLIDMGTRMAILALSAWALVHIPGIQDTSLDPTTAHRLWEACQKSSRSGTPEATAKFLAPLLEIFPNNPIYLSLAAETQTLLHRPDLSAALWERYLKVAPNPRDASPHLGRAFEEMGQMDRALGAYRRCLELNPASTDLMLFLALALELHEDRHEAEELYRKILDKSPYYNDARLGLARLLLYKGNLQEAVPLAVAALKDAPLNPEALFVAALVAEKKGQYDEGIAFVNKAIGISPDEKALHDLLERLNEYRGDRQ